MNIYYKIVEVWPQDHLIVVRYFTDTITENELASAPGTKPDGTPVRCRTDVSLSIPIPEPTEEELKKIILLNCPIGFFETQEKLKDPEIDTSMSTYQAQLNVVKTTTLEEIGSLRIPPESTPQDLTEEEINQFIKQL
jgi:hypothetical protein